MIECNQVVRELKESSDQGITFRPGLDWDNLTVGVIPDASHVGEEEWVDDWQILEPFRSQGGELVVLMAKNWREQEPIRFHLVTFNSTIVRRVCRSTIQAE